MLGTNPESQLHPALPPVPHSLTGETSKQVAIPIQENGTLQGGQGWTSQEPWKKGPLGWVLKTERD
jgi:hypothetical protein